MQIRARPPTTRPTSQALLADPSGPEALPLRPLRHRRARASPSACAAQPVYCTKIAAKLTRTYHRPVRPEGSLQGAAGRRPLQAAADLGLGRRDADRRAARPTPPPMCCTCMRSRPSSTPCCEREGRTRAGRGGLSGSCPTARGSTSPAGRTSTSSRTRRIFDGLAQFLLDTTLTEVSRPSVVGVHAYRSKSRSWRRARPWR